jgi:hypothetical protein
MRACRIIWLGAVSAVGVTFATAAYAVSFNTPEDAGAALARDIVVPAGQLPPNDPSADLLQRWYWKLPAERHAEGQAGKLASELQPARSLPRCIPIPTHWEGEVIPIPTHFDDVELVLIKAQQPAK